MTPTEQLTALRALVAAATPGPWTASHQTIDDLHFGPMSATCVDAPDKNLCAVSGLALDDARLIAAAPALATALADLAESVLGLCDEADSAGATSIAIDLVIQPVVAALDLLDLPATAPVVTT